MKIIIIILLSAVLNLNSFSQTANNVHEEKYVQALIAQTGIPQEKAIQVLAVQKSYKANLKEIMNSSQLSTELKRSGINELIKQKNVKLAVILSPEELMLLLPVSERAQSASFRPAGLTITPASATKNTASGNSSGLLEKKAERREKALLIQQACEQKIQKVQNSLKLSASEKEIRIRELYLQRNNDLADFLDKKSAAFEKTAPQVPEVKTMDKQHNKNH